LSSDAEFSNVSQLSTLNSQLLLNQFLQQLINGLSLGSIYALIALGYTMVYGVLRFINFAHGDVFMLGAYVGLYSGRYLSGKMHAEPSILLAVSVLAISMAVCAIVGVVIERLAYAPLRSRPRLTVLITAIGVSLFLEYGGQQFFGAGPHFFEPILPSYELHTGALSITSNQLVVLSVTVVLLIGLTFIVLKTKMGTAMRALSFNPTAASLMGINNNVIISFTFGLGSALAAAAGILWAVNYPSINPLMGLLPGIKAFVAAVLGGIGNIPGAALGGLILGVTETLVVGYSDRLHIPPSYRDAVAFVVLIVILLFKPSGLLGKSTSEKV
jgi:branched-chain amino acid transport system permease protein